MYIPSGIDLLKTVWRYPRYFSHLLAKKIALRRRFSLAEDAGGDDGKVPLPLLFKLYLTFKCNLRCGMCMYWGDKGVFCGKAPMEAGGELAWDVVQGLFRQTAGYHPSFILSGGEPLLYSKFADLLRLCKRAGCFAEICTNGLLLDKFFDVISDNPYVSFYLSLDGTGAINDALRGQGVYDKVVNNIKRLKSLDKPPYLGIQFTLQPENVSVLYDTCAKMVDLGVNWFFINLRWYLSDSQVDGYRKVMRDDFNLQARSQEGYHNSYQDKFDKDEFVRQCRKIQSKRWPIQVSSFLKKPEDIYDYIDKPEKYQYCRFCYKQWFRMDVMPNADVACCNQFPDLAMGNLGRASVGDLWNSRSFFDFRRFIRGRLLPVCSRCYALYLYDDKRKHL